VNSFGWGYSCGIHFYVAIKWLKKAMCHLATATIASA
jgi:hypothetical protein